MRSLGLVSLLALSLPATASQMVSGDVLRISYGDGGTWCEDDISDGRGFQTAFPEDGDGVWRDWVYPGSPWQHLTLAWELDATSYLYEGNTDYGYWDWEPTVEEDRSTDTHAVAYYEWSLDELSFTKTESWAKDGAQLMFTVTIENTGDADVENLRFHWQVDPDQDQQPEGIEFEDTGGSWDTGAWGEGTYDTLIDAVDTDGDERFDYVEGVGPSSGYTMILGACDPATQDIGSTNWDTDPDVEFVDPDGEQLDETLHVRQTIASIASGETVSFGYIVVADLDADSAATAYGDMLATCINCDGDGDGAANDSCDGDDCDDSDPLIYPGAEDTWYDGVDSNCAGDNDFDADADGFETHEYGGEDCDDTDATVYPGAEDTWYDGVDSDCAGDSDYDADGDGYDSSEHGGDDYDDTDPDVWEEPTGDDGGTDSGSGDDGGTDEGGTDDGGTDDGGTDDGGTDGDVDEDDDEGKGGCLSSTTGSGAPGPFGAGMALLGLGALLVRRRR